MAPEQLEGRIEDIDARTDIFAFGTLVYEMTTGKKAFEGTSPRQPDCCDSYLRAAVDDFAAADNPARNGASRQEMSRQGSRKEMAKCERPA